MSIPEIVEIWIRSLKAIFEAAGLEVVYTRSPPERPNPSLALTLRHGTVETDLLVWESGHADLTLMDAQGAIHQKHFDNLRDLNALADVLAGVAAILPVSRNWRRMPTGRPATKSLMPLSVSVMRS